MADAEAERQKMGASVDRLEVEKRELEATNAKTIEENRYLLDQLEELNSTVSNSDAQILSMNSTLQATRKELERLTVLAAQTSNLEIQIASLELEQANLQDRLVFKEEEERTAVQRWKGAERTILALQEQIDRIEREAREEHSRHLDVVARFERRRAVELELGSAAGRLKGAAAATALGNENGSTVVSHFVKDILQDNANLQLGVVELREMLMGSNEEVENLREQMLLHQPVPEKSTILPPNLEVSDAQQSPEGSDSLSLNKEVTMTPKEAKSDLHVHHHYHAAPEKPLGQRRPKKRRNITSPGFRTPRSGSQTPRMSNNEITRFTPTSADTILSQTSATIPPTSQASHPYRWSTQSTQASSSVPSSPRSTFRCPSVFDTMDDALDSRPTTPGSTILGSPAFQPRHFKGRGSDVSTRSLSNHASSPLQSNATQSSSSSLQDAGQERKDDESENTAFPLLEHSTILEEPEDDAAKSSSSATDPNTQPTLDDNYIPLPQIRPRLNRASSHESILSTHDLNIPKLHRTKRPQILATQGLNLLQTSLSSSTASIGPITSSTAAVGRPSNRTKGYSSSNYNRLLLSATNSSTAPSGMENVTAEKSTITIGKRVGGWMLGKWGVAPAPQPLRAKDALNAVVVDDERATAVEVNGKRTGDRLSTHVEAESVDKMLLQESLEGR